MIERKFFVRKILTVAIASAMIASCATFAYAADDEETEADLQTEINEKREELEQSEKTEEELDEKITRLSEECAATYSDIETLNIEKQTYIESMATRIVYFYENETGNGALESLLEDGFAGMLNRAEYMRELHKYDSKQLDAYTDIITKTKEKQEMLDEQVEELNRLLDEQRALQEELDSEINLAEKKLDEILKKKMNPQQGETTKTEISTPQIAATSADSNDSCDKLTKQKGVVYYGGHKETYYTQKDLPGYDLDIPGRHVASDGTIRDCNGYICVASSDVPKGTIIQTSLGTAKVYDCGCASGTIDIYTDW